VTRRRAWIIVAIAAVLVVLLLALACVDQAPAGSTATEIAEPTRTATPAPSRSPEPTATAASSTAVPASSTAAAPSPTVSSSTSGESLSQLLAALPITPEHRSGYDRDLFPLWSDADSDGCNTRYEVLIVEAVTAPTITPPCHLTGGTWFSTYDGKTLIGAQQVEVDHVVALAEAWYSGAYGWSTARREQYANDLGVPWTLVVSSHNSNQSKGSKDPAEWVPPRAADVCPYISSWIEIKTRWGLSIDQREHDALRHQLDRCPDDVVVVPRAAGPAVPSSPQP
jgi:hypothetical protein